MKCKATEAQRRMLKMEVRLKKVSSMQLILQHEVTSAADYQQKF